MKNHILHDKMTAISCFVCITSFIKRNRFRTEMFTKEVGDMGHFAYLVLVVAYYLIVENNIF